MGSRGFNAGGFAYMQFVNCPKCGRKYRLGNRRRVSGDTACLDRSACENRITKAPKRARRKTNGK